MEVDTGSHGSEQPEGDVPGAVQEQHAVAELDEAVVASALEKARVRATAADRRREVINLLAQACIVQCGDVPYAAPVIVSPDERGAPFNLAVVFARHVRPEFLADPPDRFWATLRKDNPELSIWRPRVGGHQYKALLDHRLIETAHEFVLLYQVLESIQAELRPESSVAALTDDVRSCIAKTAAWWRDRSLWAQRRNTQDQAEPHEQQEQQDGQGQQAQQPQRDSGAGGNQPAAAGAGLQPPAPRPAKRRRNRAQFGAAPQGRGVCETLQQLLPGPLAGAGLLGLLDPATAALVSDPGAPALHAGALAGLSAADAAAAAAAAASGGGFGALAGMAGLPTASLGLPAMAGLGVQQQQQQAGLAGLSGLDLGQQQLQAGPAAGAPPADGTSLSGPVVLNVGGTRFTTTMATLLSVHGSLFWQAMQGGGHTALQRQPGGEWFIDRAPGAFGYVLEFLRACAHADCTFPLPNDARELQALAREAQFYGLPALLSHIHATCLVPQPGTRAAYDCLYFETGYRSLPSQLHELDQRKALLMQQMNQLLGGKAQEGYYVEDVQSGVVHKPDPDRAEETQTNLYYSLLLKQVMPVLPAEMALESSESGDEDEGEELAEQQQQQQQQRQQQQRQQQQQQQGALDAVVQAAAACDAAAEPEQQRDQQVQAGAGAAQAALAAAALAGCKQYAAQQQQQQQQQQRADTAPGLAVG